MMMNLGLTLGLVTMGLVAGANDVNTVDDLNKSFSKMEAIYVENMIETIEGEVEESNYCEIQ